MTISIVCPIKNIPPTEERQEVLSFALSNLARRPKYDRKYEFDCSCSKQVLLVQNNYRDAFIGYSLVAFIQQYTHAICIQHGLSKAIEMKM